MIKLFKVKKKQRDDAKNSNGRPPVKKLTPGELRLQKDISELNLPETTTIAFPNGKDDLMSFEITIIPDEGYYQKGFFVFTIKIFHIYPHEAPKVKCKTKQPNYEDPLNADAAAVLRDNPKQFEANVRRAMAGGYDGQVQCI